MDSRRSSLILKLTIVLLLVEKNHGQVKQCSILINGGLAEPQTLILDPKIGKTEFLYPTDPTSGRLVISAGESFRVACPGSKLKLKASGTYDDIIVTCKDGNDFVTTIGKDTESFNKISCEKYPSFEIEPTNALCDIGTSYEIGAKLQTQITSTTKREVFLGLIDLCHDAALAHTIFAHAKISAAIGAAQTSFKRIPFRTGNFYRGVAINKLYGRKSQRETLGRILNNSTLANQYVQETGEYYFARGHLIAKSDFTYGSQQRATFFYLNAVPMWQNVNAGNWGTMEANVRSYAITRNRDLDIWAGSIGILTLADQYGLARKIHLYVDQSQRLIPVPKILYKVVYDAVSRSGIVFLTANNPYLASLSPEYEICTNVCNRINYMTWKPNIAHKGLSYCCEIDDFRRAVPNIPFLTTVSLLS